MLLYFKPYNKVQFNAILELYTRYLGCNYNDVGYDPNLVFIITSERFMIGLLSNYTEDTVFIDLRGYLPSQYKRIEKSTRLIEILLKQSNLGPWDTYCISSVEFYNKCGKPPVEPYTIFQYPVGLQSTVRDDYRILSLIELLEMFRLKVIK